MSSGPTLCGGRPHASASMSPAPRPRRQPWTSIRYANRTGAGGTARSSAGFDIALVEVTSFDPALGRYGDRGPESARRGPGRSAQHERRRTTDYSVAGAGTTVGNTQIQPAIDDAQN